MLHGVDAGQPHGLAHAVLQRLEQALHATRPLAYCRLCELDLQLHPRRWSGSTRNWSHIDVVMLNPERTEVIDAATARVNRQPMAA